jgi:hypothetical protein
MSTPNIETLANVTAILQTALTPAFLLVAIGTLLNIFVIRLSRIVDRSRELQALHPGLSGTERERLVNELRIVGKRMNVVSAMIGMLFLMGLAGVPMAKAIVAMFILALALMVGSLLLFVREVQWANHNIRVREEFLK